MRLFSLHILALALFSAPVFAASEDPLKDAPPAYRESLMAAMRAFTQRDFDMAKEQVKKADLAIDHWLKELAPSSELRKWFGHRADRWPEFQRRYRQELDNRPAEIDRLRALLHAGPVTLVYAARDEDHNNAVALRDYLDK